MDGAGATSSVELAALTAFGVVVTIAGLVITIWFHTRSMIGRRWRIATASCALICGLLFALVWSRDANDGSWVLGFPFPAVKAIARRMIEPSAATVHFAFANFVAGIGAAHTASFVIHQISGKVRNCLR